MHLATVPKQDAEGYLADIARVHSDAYSRQHFSAWLSPAMTLVYYRCLVRHSDLLVVAQAVTPRAGIQPGTLVGFALGGCHLAAGVDEFVRGHRPYLMALSLRHPTMLWKRLRDRVQSLRDAAGPPVAAFRLFSIAVMPVVQGHGVGRALLTAFEAALRLRKIPRYGLSVRSDDAAVLQFYKGDSFHFEATRGDHAFLAKDLP